MLRLACGRLVLGTTVLALSAACGCAKEGKPAPEANVKTTALFQVDKIEKVFLVAPDGRHLVVWHADEGVSVFNLQTGKQLALKQPDRFHSAAFADDGKSLWLGTVSGTAVHLTLPGLEESKEVVLGKERHIDGLALAPQGGILAWHDRKAELAGLYDLKSGKSLADWEGVTSNWSDSDHEPRVRFSPDGSLAIFYQSGAKGMGLIGQKSGRLVLWNIASGKAEAALQPYVPQQTPGYALVRDGLAYGVRTADDKWEIRRRDLKNGEEKVIVAAARPGHYLDLFASPTGRFLAEWDDEKEGIQLYDLTGKVRSRRLGKDKLQFAGWVATGQAEFLLATSDKDGLALWDPADGLLRGTIPGMGGKRCSVAALTLDASRLVLLWDATDIGETVEYHVTVLKVEDFPSK